MGNQSVCRKNMSPSFACWIKQQVASRAIPSETSVDFQRTSRRYIPEDKTIHNQRRENLKSWKHTVCSSHTSRYHGSPVLPFPSIMEQLFILDYTQLTFNSLKCSWNVIKVYSISGYKFRPHKAIFRRHTLMEPTTLCSRVNSTCWCTSSLYIVHQRVLLT
jgi:hypothetical protein